MLIPKQKNATSLKWLGRGVAFFAIIAIGAYGAIRFIEHEKHQDEKIADLQEQVAHYKDNLKSQKNNASPFSEDGFNYLAIGNSITKHGICEYWWDEIGMAASSERNDYVHLVAEGLGTNVNVYALNFYVWEIQSTDRAETLTILEQYLPENLNLVTIQLGENVTNRDTLELDYEELIRYIQDRCPNAQVMLIGEFWEDSEIESIKNRAAAHCSIDFIDISSIWKNAEYMVGLGATVYGADGKEHIVEHEGVAAHPSDEGMRFIAEGILEFVDGKSGISEEGQED